MDNNQTESMKKVYIYETMQEIEQLKLSVLKNDESKSFSSDSINEIFRIMRTTKSFLSMMGYQNIT